MQMLRAIQFNTCPVDMYAIIRASNLLADRRKGDTLTSLRNQGGFVKI